MNSDATDNTDNNDHILGEKEKISILIAEYNRLNTEIIQKNSFVVQSIGIGLPVCVGFTTFAVSIGNKISYFAAIVIAVIVTMMLIIIDSVSVKLMRRVRDLEHEINRRAGERLLRWESDFSWGGALFPRRRKHSP